MRMLDELKTRMHDIEIDNVNDFNFLQSIIIQREQYPDIQLSGKQFGYLISIHNRYTNARTKKIQPRIEPTAPFAFYQTNKGN